MGDMYPSTVFISVIQIIHKPLKSNNFPPPKKEKICIRIQTTHIVDQVYTSALARPLLPHYPTLYRSPVILKIDADFDDLFATGFVWNRIAFVIDMLKSFFGSAIQFKFK